MDALTRRLALRRAAKVAFGPLVFGCGGAVVAGQGPKQANVDVLPTPDGSAPRDAGAKAASLACAAPTELDASVDPDTFECCIGVVEQLTGDAGFKTIDPSVVAADPSVDHCCKAILAFVDQGRGYSEAIPTLGTCCGANHYPRGGACTPWGPPSPPEMEAA